MTNAAPKMLLLLIKSDAQHPGKFAHSGKYFLHQGRWHKLNQDKPVPKGAAIAAHPHAAGAPTPMQTYTDEQWEQLKLPTENSNASTFNKQVDQLKAAASAGDVTGILGSGYGINTYSKKLAIIANHVLGMLGSTHTVTPGQKPGAHAAVQTAPQIEAGEPAPVEPAAADPFDAPIVGPSIADLQAAGHLPTQPSMPAFHEGKTTTGVLDYYQKVGQKVLDLAAAGDVAGLEKMKADGLKPNSKGKVSNTWAGKTANSKLLLDLHDQALLHAGKSAAVQHLEQDQKQSDIPASEKAEDKQLVAEIKDKPAGEAVDAALDHLNGDEGQDNLPAAEKKEDAELVSKLEAAQGDQEPVKNESPETATDSAQPAAAEPAPIKKEPRLVLPKKARVAAPAPVEANPATGKLDQIPWDALKLPDSNKNAKSHNKQVDKIKALAMAGDVAGLEAFKAGKNTYGKQQNLLAQTALAALKEGGQDAQPAAPAATDAAEAAAAKLAELKEAAGKAGYGVFQHPKKGWLLGGNDHSYKTFANLKQAEEAVAKLTAVGLDAHVGASNPYLVHITGKSPEMQTPSAAASKHDTSPKEGDTKEGAEGMLVLKDGHWVKVEHDKPADPAPASTDKSGPPAPPEFSALGGDPKWANNYATVAAALHAKVLAEGADAFKGVVVSHSDGRFSITLAGFKLKKFGPDDKQEYRKQMHAYVTALKAATGKPKKVSKPKAAPSPAPSPAADAQAIESIDTWQQTGPQGGSNPGGRFKDHNGVEWYCKFPEDEDMAKAEVLASKLYAALGISGQDAKLVRKFGKVGIASKWTTVTKAINPAVLAKVDGVASGFGADAWLGNWDVVGLGFDNLQIGADGKAHRVDAGGSLMYRAQGGKKAFGKTVTEIDSLRDPKINAQAAKVFGGMTDADITASVAKVLKLSDATIFDLVMEHGPGSLKDKADLIDTLVARKADLAAKFPKAKPKEKRKPDPKNLKVTSDQLAQPHDFANWNGPGKGLSSKTHVNEANAKAEKDLLDFALKGNLIALQDYHYDDIDKETGQVAGKKHIQQHPSKHVKDYWSDLVATLSYIAYPPEALKRFATVVATSVKKVSDAFKSHAYGMTTAKADANTRLAYWIAIGNTKPATALLVPGASVDFQSTPTGVPKMTDAMRQQAKAKYGSLSSSRPVRRFINGIQSSGTYNDNFRDGLMTTKDGHNAVAMVKDAYDYASEKPEGFEIYKWLSFPKDMKQQMLASPAGTVFQNPGSMCCSYEPNATSGFGADRMRVRYAKGAKAVDSFGSGNFSGEKEITTLPGQRFVILSCKKVMCPVKGKERVELDVLMLPPDETYLAELDAMKGTK